MIATKAAEILRQANFVLLMPAGTLTFSSRAL